MRGKRRILTVTAVVVGVMALLAVLLHLAVNSGVLKERLERFIEENVDGDLAFSRLKVSLFGTFPDISAEVDDLSLTYPHDRFSAFDGAGMKSVLNDSGRGAGKDTLASLGYLSVRVNPWKLFKSRIVVKELRLDSLRVHAHSYSDSLANWNMFRFASDKEKDDGFSIPDISLEKPAVISAAEMVYTDLPASVAARLSLDELRLAGHGLYDILLRAGLLAQLPGVGEMDIPVKLKGSVALGGKGDSMDFSIPSLDARIANIPIHVDGNASFCPDGIPMNVNLGVDACGLDSLIRTYASSFVPSIDGLSTDARLSLDANAKGVWSESSRPEVNAAVTIPTGTVRYAPLNFAGKISLDAGVSDLLGADPLFKVRGLADAILDTITLPEETGIDLSGHVHTLLDCVARKSELSGKELQKASLRAELGGDSFGITMDKDTIRARVFSPKLIAVSNTDGLDLKFDMDSLSFRKGVSLLAKVRDMNNHGRVTKVNVRKERVPKLEIASSASVYFQSGADRMGAQNLKLTFEARKTPDASEARRKAFLDSLQFVHPGVARQDLPSFLQEKDFEKGDIEIKLDSSLTALMRRWNPKMSIALEQGAFSSPVMPLRTRIRNLSAAFDGDKLSVNSVSVTSGSSDVSINGQISGLRRAILSKGVMQAQFAAHSSRINVNELSAAYEIGLTIPKDTSSVTKEYDESFVVDTLEDSDLKIVPVPLIIVPANLIARVDARVDRIDVMDLDVHSVSGTVRMQERTFQVMDAKAYTDVGDLDADAFYSTRTKEDITAGLNFDMSDIPIHKVVSMIPQTEDKLPPALQSFDGRLECSVSVTTQLDTCMNPILPSVDGVIHLKGTDMSISDAGDLRRVTRLLMFKNKDIGPLDDMNINAVIHNGKVEIFPFEFGADRYRLALQGMQGLDKTLYYHISVLKAPFPVHFGVDLYGTTDNWRVGLTRSKYKDGAIPQFAEELEAMKTGVSNAVHNVFTRDVEFLKGRRERLHAALESRKKSLNYSLESTSLSQEEYSKIDSLNFVTDNEGVDKALEEEVQTVLDESFAETDKILKSYADAVYDKRVLKKIERLKTKKK